jgi:hypothetical protein
MHPSAGLVLLLLIAACALPQEERSPAELACIRQAEQVMADRNRSRNLWLDAGLAGPQTIVEDTAVIPRVERQMDIVERDRLTRECLRRAQEQAQAGGPQPAQQPSRGWSLPPAILRW